MISDSVFMIGWEYPPHNSGGLGVACQGLTQALSEQGQQIYFTLPYQHTDPISHMNVVGCYDPKWFESKPETAPPFASYDTQIPDVVSYSESGRVDTDQLRALPQSEMEYQVTQYAEYVAETAKTVDNSFSVVHAHDWMSFPAAVKIKQQQQKPFIAHVHSTEYDRIPNGHGSYYITKTEYDGLQLADKVVAVSEYTKRLIVRRYSVPAHKIDVVYNGIDPVSQYHQTKPFAHKRPVVVFMGRLTMQKGAEYFINLARHVLAHIPNALFIVAGSGDQYHSLILKNAASQLSANLLFSGFVRGEQKAALLNRADVFVMPSVSEPFGLVALEAAQRHTPVIISKHAGVAEVLPSAKVVDFWDMHQMTSEIVQLLEDKGYHRERTVQQIKEVDRVNWQASAKKMRQVYTNVFRGQ